MELVDYWKILDIASIFRGRSWRANIYAVEPVNNSHPRDWSKWPLCTGDRYRQVGYNMRSSRDLLNVVVIAGSTVIYTLEPLRSGPPRYGYLPQPGTFTGTIKSI